MRCCGLALPHFVKGSRVMKRKRVVVIGDLPNILTSQREIDITHLSTYGVETVSDVRGGDGLISRLPDADAIVFRLNIGGAHKRDPRHGAILLRILQQRGKKVLVEGQEGTIKLGATESVRVRSTDLLTESNLERVLA